MIFVGGVHGVGKSFLCSLARKRYGINAYSSGVLIAAYKKDEYLSDKKVDDISHNQNILKLALQEIEKTEKNFLLDGHFCLYNKFGKIEEIASAVFKELKPKAILILIAPSSVLYERLSSRDGIIYSLEELGNFQEHEIQHAKQIASNLGVPIEIQSDMEKGLAFIGSQLEVEFGL